MKEPSLVDTCLSEITRNYCNGKKQPSQSDIALTKKLKEAGDKTGSGRLVKME